MILSFPWYKQVGGRTCVRVCEVVYFKRRHSLFVYTVQVKYCSISDPYLALLLLHLLLHNHIIIIIIIIIIIADSFSEGYKTILT